VVGDLKGLTVAEYQPAKLAAMEAHWQTNTEGGAPFVLFAVPDMEKGENRLQIAVPNVLSLLITHSLGGKVQGLEEFPRHERPNALITFWSFRIMVAIGFLFAGIMIWALVLWRRKRLYASRRFLQTLVLLQPLGFAATVMGWVTAEVGRQPWVVYGLMRTADGVSPIAAGNVMWSLTFFLGFFGLIGASYFYYIFKTLARGPDLDSPIPPVQRPTGMRPFKEAMQRR
jgi:cytochrome d ubiquinol oxidase subunit I